MKIFLLIGLFLLYPFISDAQFVQVENPNDDFYLGAYPVVESHGKLFSITGVQAGFDSDGVKLYESSDEGVTWTEVVPEDGFFNQDIEPRTLFGNDSLLIFSARRQVIMSKDGGLNWTSLPDIASTQDEDRGSVFAVIDDVILAGTADDTNNGGTGIYRQEAGGEWELIIEGLDNDEPNGSPNIIQISINKDRVLVSASDGFYISDDKGLTFTRTVENDIKLEFTVKEDTVVANSTAGGRRDFAFMVSYDNGSTFEEIRAEQVLDENVFSRVAQEAIINDGELFYIGISERYDSLDGGVWRSDNLLDWENIGFQGIPIGHLSLTPNRMFVSVNFRSSSEKGLYYIERDELVFTSAENKADVPSGFTLKQNYPNPFNPSTTIGFSLESAGNVKLEVFDVLGRKVATLLNREMSSGEHSARFDAGNLSSGIYLYRLETDGVAQTRYMTLIK